MTIKTMSDLSLAGKRVLFRLDLNVPIADQKVTSDIRIRAALPSIQRAIDAGATVMVMSHLGRPTEGEYEQSYSLSSVVEHMQGLVDYPVRLLKDYLGETIEHTPGECIVLENVRFNKGEKKDCPELAKAYADLCDVFVMDAFGTAHRAQASTHGVAKFAPEKCAGLLLQQELEALKQAVEHPQSPILAIVGGSKVSTKLTVLESLSKKVDQLIVGGGIANTFIAANGHDVGKSLVELDFVDEARRIQQQAEQEGRSIPVPTDVVVGAEFSADTSAHSKAVSALAADDMIFDFGAESIAVLVEYIRKAKTIVWNGPVGVFEFEAFSKGTEAIAHAIAASDAFSIAGGGDTLAAIEKYGIADHISYISTGGGAFLEFLEGKTLPAVAALEV